MAARHAAQPSISSSSRALWLVVIVHGRLDEAEKKLRQAETLDPTSAVIKKTLAQVSYARRDFDRATLQLQEALKLAPDYPLPHACLARLHLARTNYLEAIAEWERYELADGRDPLKVAAKYDARRQAYAKDGAEGYWRQCLEEGTSHLYTKAEYHARLGEKEEALTCLERAYEKRGDYMLTTLLCYDCWDRLRAELRFINLVERIGLVP